MASPVTVIFFADADTPKLYESKYRKWCRHWPRLAELPTQVICDAATDVDAEEWREKFFFLERVPKIVLWDWRDFFNTEPTIDEKIQHTTISCGGFTSRTPYYFMQHPSLQTERAGGFPETARIDMDDPPMVICNRTEMTVDDKNYAALEAWAADAPGFDEFPSVDQAMVKAFDIGIIRTNFARVLSIVTKNNYPVGRSDFLLYYAALRRGEKIKLVDSSEMGILE